MNYSSLSKSRLVPLLYERERAVAEAELKEIDPRKVSPGILKRSLIARLKTLDKRLAKARLQKVVNAQKPDLEDDPKRSGKDRFGCRKEVTEESFNVRQRNQIPTPENRRWKTTRPEGDNEGLLCEKVKDWLNPRRRKVPGEPENLADAANGEIRNLRVQVEALKLDIAAAERTIIDLNERLKTAHETQQRIVSESELQRTTLRGLFVDVVKGMTSSS